MMRDELMKIAEKAGDIASEAQGKGGSVSWRAVREIESELRALAERPPNDTERLNYIERTFSGMTNRERYLTVTMIWGKGANGRTLREACDKYIARDAARPAQGVE